MTITCLMMTLNFDSLTSKCKGTFLSQSCIYLWTFYLLTPKCIGIFLSQSCIYVWNLYVENYSGYLVEPVLTKFSCDLDLLTPKCIGIFLLPSCIYVWNMKAVRWKLLKLLCQTQSIDKVQLWPWPFDPKMYRYLPLTILHLCMKYESCTLKTTQVIVSDPKCW